MISFMMNILQRKFVLVTHWYIHILKNVLSALATDLIHPFAEPEAIQYLPEHNSILLSVTWHLDCPKNIFTNNPFFKTYGQDKTFIYEIPVID